MKQSVKQVIACIRYRLRYGIWPSRLQRLYMRGDPTGEVARVADAIYQEIKRLEADDNETSGNGNATDN